MMKLDNRYSPKTLQPLGAALLVAIALGGCMSPAQETAANRQEDQNVCTSMGASYGSSAYTQCMLQQQKRRDQEHLIIAEQARIAQETALNAQRMRQNQQN